MEKNTENDIEKKFFTDYYKKRSIIQNLFHSDTHEIDIKEYSIKFRELVLNHLKLNEFMNNQGDLENLHNFCSKENIEYDKYDINPIQKSLYSLTEKNRDLYHEFISKCLRSYFPFDFFFQKEITFRVHIPPQKGNNHRNPFPSFHMDSCLGHPPNEINIWIPLTKLDSHELHSFNLSSVSDPKKLLEKMRIAIYTQK